MNTLQQIDKPSPRSTIIAVLLSVAATGSGHIYCGRLIKGLILFFISFAFAPLIVTAAQHAASAFMLVLVIGSLLIMLVVFIYAAVDAGLTARSHCDGYCLKEYNRWYLYVLLIIVSLTYPTNLATSIRDHVMQAFKIPTASMMPNVLSGDYILLNKAVYKLRPPQRGDVVVFIYPDDRRRNYIKRIVALPGDTFEMRGGEVFVNDHPLTKTVETQSTALKDSPQGNAALEVNDKAEYMVFLDQTRQNIPKLSIPHGHCYVLGDNRSQSIDSRQFGPVPLVDVKGRLDYIYLPAKSWSRFGKFEQQKYSAGS